MSQSVKVEGCSGTYKVSVYKKGKLSSLAVAQFTKDMGIAFGNSVSEETIGMVIGFAKKDGWTDERLKAATENLIKNHVYLNIFPAHILSFDKTFRFYKKKEMSNFDWERICNSVTLCRNKISGEIGFVEYHVLNEFTEILEPYKTETSWERQQRKEKEAESRIDFLTLHDNLLNALKIDYKAEFPEKVERINKISIVSFDTEKVWLEFDVNDESIKFDFLAYVNTEVKNYSIPKLIGYRTRSITYLEVEDE